MIESHSIDYHFIHDENSTDLIIFFSGTTKINGRFDFWKTAHNINANALLVNNSDVIWYQNGIKGLGNTIDDTVNQIKKICSERNIQNIITVGLSMGGYGAALFATKLNCRAIVFGTDTKLAIKGSRSFRVKRKCKIIAPDLLPLIKSSKCYVLIYAGEMDVMDLYGAQRIQHLPNVTVKYLRGIGHGVAPYLKEELGLERLLNSFLVQSPLPISSLERKTEHSTIVVEHLYKSKLALAQDNIELAKKHINAAKSLEPEAEYILYMAGIIAEKQDDLFAAKSMYSSVIANIPNFKGALIKLAHIMRKIGEVQGAIDLYKRFIRLNYNDGAAHFWLGRLMYETGSTEEGILYLNKSLKLKINDKYNNYIKNIEPLIIKGAGSVYNSEAICNDFSGSKDGVLWCKNWGISKDKLHSISSVTITAIDSILAKNFIKSSIKIGSYSVYEHFYDDKRGAVGFKLCQPNRGYLRKIDYINEPIYKNSIYFKLCMN